ncbi:adenosylmethionine-8-amino-7-oxononanoate aminotransferase [Melghirimyces profundicolus]|uniref:Adenosylmethionine-8-amino-7-oxononanoate aminotransferase n=1 Tax=Melghirimyces profundicolus TaxID=1242148 RepID=A0A2T6BCC1_9BACL|nr:aspartate aminotransferase family protein [Melghirimyces profundicolus]PTX53703.1 adenosylmethionine-8-amino-7-oxononanoate aminotransferase [Melghirimyces profundicolus]
MAANVSLQSQVEELKALDQKHYLHPATSPKKHAEQGPKIIFSGGNGITVRDPNGKSYIDGVSMLWNVNLGHGRKELADAASEQMMKIAYSSSFAGYSNEPAIRLAEKLASLTPGNLNTVFYTSGGSESNDTAFKLARFYWQMQNQPKKKKIISLKQGYHGVTIAAGTATTLTGFHKFAGTHIGDVYHAKPHLTRCELGDKDDPDYKGCIRDIVEKEGPETVAAVILEPVQGSGGVYIPPEGYLKAVRQLCDEYHILFIADEVICGFGRTGRMFGVDHWGVIPDIMCVAKGITSGYVPLGGVLLNQAIHQTLVQYDQVLAHGFTYSGHPTACAVALKTLEILERDQVVAHVKRMEKELNAGLNYLEKKHRIVTKTRNIGLMGAFELYADPDNDTPFDPSLKAGLDVVEECFQRGLLLRALGAADGKNVVAIAPPLIIDKSEIGRMIDIIDDAIHAFETKIGI